MPLSPSVSRISLAASAVLIAASTLSAAPAFAADPAGDADTVVIVESDTGHDGGAQADQLDADDLLEPDAESSPQGGDDDAVEAFEAFVEVLEYSDSADDGVDIAVEEPAGQEPLLEEPAPSETTVDVLEPDAESAPQGGDDLLEPDTEDVSQPDDDGVVEPWETFVDVVDEDNPDAGGFHAVDEQPAGEEAPHAVAGVR